MEPRGTADRLSPAELRAWQGLLRVVVPTLRVLDEDLKRRHDLSENKYDVLIQLGLSPHRRLRMSELAEHTVMTRSGVSRLVDELVRDGMVIRERDPLDARGYNVALTPTGRTRLRAANRTHLARVRALVLDRLSDGQLEQLHDVWATLRQDADQDDPPPS